MSTLTQVLADVLEIKGVMAAAVVSVDGEILGGGAADTALLDRITGAVTSALAAGEALAGLLLAGRHEADEEADGADLGVGADAADGVGGVSAATQLMVIYEDGGPILFTPLPGGERVAVVALRSTHDLGRARFRLRAFTQPLASASVTPGGAAVNTKGA